jgi:F-type H+-transporting ATPase subunit alpha
MLDKVPVEDITSWEKSFVDHLRTSQEGLLKEISGGKMTPEIESKIKDVINKCVVFAAEPCDAVPNYCA